jgi:hypothetical protein
LLFIFLFLSLSLFLSFLLPFGPTSLPLPIPRGTSRQIREREGKQEDT